VELLRCRTASGLATLIPANACQHIVVTHGCRRGGLQGTRGAGGAAALPQGAPLCAAAGLGQHHRLHHAALLCAAAHHPARTCLSTFFSKILCMLQGFKGHWQMPLPSSRRATPRCRASSGAHITPPNLSFVHPPPPPPRTRARRTLSYNSFGLLVCLHVAQSSHCMSGLLTMQAMRLLTQWHLCAAPAYTPRGSEGHQTVCRSPVFVDHLNLNLKPGAAGAGALAPAQRSQPAACSATCCASQPTLARRLERGRFTRRSRLWQCRRRCSSAAAEWTQAACRVGGSPCAAAAAAAAAAAQCREGGRHAVKGRFAGSHARAR